MPLLLLVFSPQIASITRSGISPQPELRLQYLLQIWKALCMGFRYIACILHSLIAKNVRFFNAMTLAKTGPMGSFAHSSTSTRPLILISIATSIVQPTGSSKNLKLLKVTKWLLSYVHFSVFDLMGFASITRSGISPQPELRLQYLLQIWKALCMGFRYIACILHSLIAKNVRFFNAMTLAKTGPMGSFAHSSTSTRPLILISIATSIVQPTGSSKSVILQRNSD